MILVRYHPGGKRDFSFGNGGLVRTDLGGKEEVYGIAVQRDDRILIAGHTEKGGEKEIFTLRTTAEGFPDFTFGTGGIVRLAFEKGAEAHYMALQKDGKIVVAGFSEGRILLLRLLPSGEPDSSFGEGGIVLTGWGEKEKAFGLAIQRDGKIVVAGSAFFSATKEDCVVARFLPGGRPDKNFGVEGRVILLAGIDQDVCSSVAIHGDGKIVVAGFSTQAGSQTDFLVGRLLPNGNWDKTFNKKGWETRDFAGGFDLAHAIVPAGKGTIWVAGEAAQRAGASWKKRQSRIALARYLQSGVPDPSFGERGFFFPEWRGRGNASAEAMALAENGDVILAGFLKNALGLVRVAPVGVTSKKSRSKQARYPE